MSDRFYPTSVSSLFKRISTEFDKKNEIFGIPEILFCKPSSGMPFSFERYGQFLETPLGVAAGPHTQMAQNIVAAWLTGARYLELKTVQVLDEIEVSKPCIDMEDEGYNCEWSQELNLEQSFDEYLKAWVLIHVMKHKYGWKSSGSEPGMIFNMSVGYSLEGILSPKVQKFLAKMKNAKEYIEAARNELRPLYPEIDEVVIPERISDNLTLSTMHGCPPDEIEKIGMYLIKEHKLHTTIKLNPTLLGPEKLREILNEKLGFETEVPDEAFEHDLKYPDAVKILRNLEAAAAEAGVKFGIKLTNTLESINNKDVFSSSEQMMYASGRALHPISINVARKLQKEFDGRLDISFSGGATALNIVDIIKTGIKPVTVCSDILKPGGYGRLQQYAENLRKAMKGYSSIEEFILDGKDGDAEQTALENLEKYADSVIENPLYKKESRPWGTIKSERKLGFFDCVAAPCMTQCPTHQDIPSYLHATAKGDFKEAFEIITKTNPMPFSTGYACDHTCQNKCTRINYDEPLKIREIKRFNAIQNKSSGLPAPATSNNKTVAIIGGGPGGISAAYYLTLSGFKVTLFEKNEKSGGMLSQVLPDFRLTNEVVSSDIEKLEKYGVEFSFGTEVDAGKLKQIISDFDYVHIAVGAPRGKRLGIENEDIEGMIDFLDFLNGVKTGKITGVPEVTAIIGAGNSAMDAARTAWRLSPANGRVILVYRRTRKEMPADYEELKGLIEEGIEIMELTNPVAALPDSTGKLAALRCVKMQLGEKDEKGRRRPVPVEGSEFELPVDMVIKALGQNTDLSFVSEAGIELTPYGTIKVDQDKQTSVAGVYAGGDAVHGAKSIIQAVADGKEAAAAIIGAEGGSLNLDYDQKRNIQKKYLQQKRARINAGQGLRETSVNNRKNFDIVIKTYTETEAEDEASRCLLCDEFCDVCVTVCPNRANVSYEATPKSYAVGTVTVQNGKIILNDNKIFTVTQKPQIVNIGDYCNECGNCTTFCPTGGRPFADKPKFYLDRSGFEAENDNAHFYSEESGIHKIEAVYNSGKHVLYTSSSENNYVYEVNGKKTVLAKSDLSVISHELKDGDSVDLSVPASLSVMLDAFVSGSLIL